MTKVWWSKFNIFCIFKCELWKRRIWMMWSSTKLKNRTVPQLLHSCSKCFLILLSRCHVLWPRREPWLLPSWKRVCSRLCGAATGLFSTRVGVAGVRLQRCSQAQCVLTRGGTTTTAAAGSWRASGWRGWRRSVTGQTTIFQPVGRQFYFVWGIKVWLLRFTLEVQPETMTFLWC